MIPTHEGFEARQPARLQTNNRLVIDTEFFLLDRLAQVAFQLQTRHSARVHVVIEEFVTSFAVFLRAIHRDVRVAQDIVGAVVTTRAQRDPNTRGRKCGILVEHKRLAQFVLNSSRDAHCVSRILYPAQENRELIATEARERINRPQRSFESFCKSNEKQVAVRMAQTIVDVFEAIQIEEEHCEHMTVSSLRAFDLGFE